MSDKKSGNTTAPNEIATITATRAPVVNALDVINAPAEQAALEHGDARELTEECEMIARQHARLLAERPHRQERLAEEIAFRATFDENEFDIDFLDTLLDPEGWNNQGNF